MVCSKTKFGRHDKKLLQQKSLRNLTWVYKFMTKGVFEVKVRYQGTSSMMSNTF